MPTRRPTRTQRRPQRASNAEQAALHAQQLTSAANLRATVLTGHCAHQAQH